MNGTRRGGRSTLAVALAGMMLLGAILVAVPSQQRNAYAHTFSGDESAGFLELVENIKIELGLVQSNLASNNMTLAHEHAEHAHDYIDEHVVSEIAERNQRLATDLPAALEDLLSSVSTSTEQQIQTKIQNINDLLGETVSVRVEQSQLSNSTVHALVLANLLTSISYQGHGHYEIAVGIGEHHTHGQDEEDAHAHEEGDGHDDEHSMSSESSSHDNMTTMMTEEEMAPVTIVDMAHYQTARAVAVRAQELWTELKSKVPQSADSHDIAEIDSALPDLVEAIDAKATNGDIQAIIHGRIHPHLMTIFGLELEMHMGDMEGDDHDHDATGGGDDHDHETPHSHAHIPDKLMLYVEETGEHIHEQHMAENAPISSMYKAGTRYTVTLESDDDAKVTLEVAAWKSAGRVLYLDIIGGSVMTMGDDGGNETTTMTVNSGQAYYIPDNKLMFAFGVVVMTDEHGDSADLLKLRAVFPTQDGGSVKLPDTASGSLPLESHVKIGSDWSSMMAGQVTLS
ncbi:MAG: hypothetical protein HRF40_05115 [Nitrososphaera sp.]